MGKAGKGRAGCGCLLVVLVVCMVAAGALVHPFSLRIIAGRFRYEDKLVPCDAIYVPRFPEDKNGEVYTDAFREYWAGDGKAIWVEDDHVLGLSIKDIVARMAKERGIKEAAVKALTVEGDDETKARLVMKDLTKQGVKKVIVMAPEYDSKRYQMLYGGQGPEERMLVLVKPVHVSYFKRDEWWKDELSRLIMGREFYRVGLLYAEHFGFGKKEEPVKGEAPR